jgi:hypothetical protein
MKSFSKLLLLILSLVAAACGQEKKETLQEESDVRYGKQKQLESLNLFMHTKYPKH